MALVARPDFSVMWAESGARQSPTTAKIGTGWVAEIPPYQWENAVQYRQDQGIKYLMQRGVPEWSASEDYAGGLSYTVGGDGVLYRAVLTSGPTTAVVNPVTNNSLSHWVPVNRPASVGIPGLVEFANVNDAVIGLANNKAITPELLTILFSSMIVHFPQTTPPDGWLVCNGAAISRAAYATLFGRIGTRFGSGNGTSTFNLPDLRGVFIRGNDEGRGLDLNRVFGSLQQSQNLSHNHTGQTSVGGAHTHTTSIPLVPHTSSGGNYGVTDSSSGQVSLPFTTQSGGDHSHGFTTNPSGGNESRPVNVSLLPCIKF
jgi:microcystin-dependent protein